MHERDILSTLQQSAILLFALFAVLSLVPLLQPARKKLIKWIPWLDQKAIVASRIGLGFFLEKVFRERRWAYLLLLAVISSVLVTSSLFVQPLNFLAKLPSIISLGIAMLTIAFMLSILLKLSGALFLLIRRSPYQIWLLILCYISFSLLLLSAFIDTTLTVRNLATYRPNISLNTIILVFTFFGTILFGADVLKPNLLKTIDQRLAAALEWKRLRRNIREYVIVDLLLLGSSLSFLLFLLFLAAYWFIGPAEDWIRARIGDRATELIFYYCITRLAVGLPLGLTYVICNHLGIRVLAKDYQRVMGKSLFDPETEEVGHIGDRSRWYHIKNWIGDIATDYSNAHGLKRAFLLSQVILFAIAETMDDLIFIPLILAVFALFLPYYVILFICSALASLCRWLAKHGPFTSTLRTIGLLLLTIAFLTALFRSINSPPK